MYKNNIRLKIYYLYKIKNVNLKPFSFPFFCIGQESELCIVNFFIGLSVLKNCKLESLHWKISDVIHALLGRHPSNWMNSYLIKKTFEPCWLPVSVTFSHILNQHLCLMLSVCLHHWRVFSFITRPKVSHMLI